MDFDLTDDQVALRDGDPRAASRGGSPIGACPRAGSTASMCDELADAGVFSLRADGFGWADAAIVFEELGRGARARPARVARSSRTSSSTASARPRVVGGIERPPAARRSSSSTSTRSTRCSCSTTHGARRVDPAALRARSQRLAARSAHAGRAGSTRCPPGERVAGRRRRGRVARVEGAVLTAALQVGMARRVTERLAVDVRARSASSSTGPIGSFQAVKHLLADMAVRAEVARAAVHAAARARSTIPRSATSTARSRRASCSRARPRCRTAKAVDAGARRHGLHLGGRRPPLPEARLGARHRTSAPPTTTPTRSPRAAAPSRGDRHPGPCENCRERLGAAPRRPRGAPARRATAMGGAERLERQREGGRLDARGARVDAPPRRRARSSRSARSPARVQPGR